MSSDHRSWCKVASNLDSHPKIRRGGRLAREVYLFVLRRNAEPGNQYAGSVHEHELEPWYVADQLQMSEAEAKQGLASCLSVGLLREKLGRFEIVGWDDEWGRQPMSGRERTERWRQNKELRESVTNCDGPSSPDRHTVTSPVTSKVTCDACDAGEERRGEEIRREDPEMGPARPPRVDLDQAPAPRPPHAPPERGGVLALVPDEPRKAPGRARRARPSEPSEVERAAAERILAKLGEHNGVRYAGSSAHLRLMAARIRDGADEMDLRKIVGYCALELGWAQDPKMAKYLRPETLFGPETIARYLDPARAWADTLPRSRPKEAS